MQEDSSIVRCGKQIPAGPRNTGTWLYLYREGSFRKQNGRLDSRRTARSVFL